MARRAVLAPAALMAALLVASIVPSARAQAPVRLYLPLVTSAALPPPGSQLPTAPVPAPTRPASATPTPTAPPGSSLTPSPTSPPTFTSAPNSTPTPPAAPSSAVTILGNTFGFVDGFRYFHVLGEVRNVSDAFVHNVKLTADIFAANAQFLGSTSTYAQLSALGPRATTCFHAVFAPGLNASTYRLSATSTLGGQDLPRLTVSNDVGSAHPNTSVYQLAGQIRNDDSQPVHHAKVIVTLYTAGSTVVGCEEGFSSVDPMTPGQSGSFLITARGRSYADVARYRLQPDGGY